MAEKTGEVTVDLDTADAAAAAATTKGADKANGAAADPEVVVDAGVTAADASKDGITPEQALEKLQKQLNEERSKRQAAETRADESARAEADARGSVQTTQLDLVKQAITTVSTENDSLEEKLAEAQAAQDWKEAAKIQRKMGDNSAKLAQLEAGKAAIERAPKPVPRGPVDVVEEFCAQLSPKSAAWVRAHPQFVSGGRESREYKQMIAAHELAKARGHTEDTAEYFTSIEKTLELGPAATLPAHVDDPIKNDPAQSAAVATGGRHAQSAPPAAPVSRGGNGGGSPRSNTVTLTADEVEIAEASGMTPEEYARQKIALRKEGKLS